MFALNIGIVVVRNAENPTMSGWCSRTASTNLSGRDLHPEIDDVEPGAFQHDVHEVLADVVHVAFDSAHDESTDRLDAGLGEQRPQHLERTGHGAARDEHLGHEEVAPLETGTDLLERGDERLEQHRLGIEPHLQAGVGELEHLGGVAHEGGVVHLLEQLFLVHAAPALWGR